MKKDPRDPKNWKPLITYTSDGTRVYCETFTGESDETFFNVASGTGNIRINTIKTFTADLTDIEGRKVSPFLYGHRMLLEDYNDIIKEKHCRMISWIDLSKELDLSVEWIRNLLGLKNRSNHSENTKRLQPTALKGIWFDGASLWAKDFREALQIIDGEVARRRTYRAKQRANARWGNKRMVPSSGSSR